MVCDTFKQLNVCPICKQKVVEIVYEGYSCDCKYIYMSYYFVANLRYLRIAIKNNNSSNYLFDYEWSEHNNEMLCSLKDTYRYITINKEQIIQLVKNPGMINKYLILI